MAHSQRALTPCTWCSLNVRSITSRSNLALNVTIVLPCRVAVNLFLPCWANAGHDFTSLFVMWCILITLPGISVERLKQALIDQLALHVDGRELHLTFPAGRSFPCPEL